MSLDFSHAPEPSNGNRVLIPEGTLCGGMIKLDRDANGQLVHYNANSGNRYMKAIVEIKTAPYAGMKIYDTIAVESKSADFMQLSDIKIRAILECNGAGPNNPAGYSINARTDIDGKKCAIRVMVDTKSDKPRNQVGTFLSPIAKSTKDDFEKLVRGEVHPPDPMPSATQVNVVRPREAPGGNGYALDPAEPPYDDAVTGDYDPTPPDWIAAPERANG